MGIRQAENTHNLSEALTGGGFELTPDCSTTNNSAQRLQQRGSQPLLRGTRQVDECVILNLASGSLYASLKLTG